MRGILALGVLASLALVFSALAGPPELPQSIM